MYQTAAKSANGILGIQKQSQMVRWYAMPMAADVLFPTRTCYPVKVQDAVELYVEPHNSFLLSMSRELTMFYIYSTTSHVVVFPKTQSKTGTVMTIARLMLQVLVSESGVERRQCRQWCHGSAGGFYI